MECGVYLFCYQQPIFPQFISELSLTSFSPELFWAAFYGLIIWDDFQLRVAGWQEARKFSYYYWLISECPSASLSFCHANYPLVVSHFVHTSFQVTEAHLKSMLYGLIFIFHHWCSLKVNLNNNLIILSGLFYFPPQNLKWNTLASLVRLTLDYIVKPMYHVILFSLLQCWGRYDDRHSYSALY